MCGMAINQIFRGHIERGKLILDDPGKYFVRLSGLEGQRVELIVRKQKSQRSLNQNSAYWGIAIEILCSHTGYDRETMHEALKAKFASYEDLKTGLMVIESTAKMDTVRFMKYYDDIQRWAAEFLNCYIPSPNEPDWAAQDLQVYIPDPTSVEF